MFQSLRQQRAMSPTQDTPRAIPSIRLTSATPIASSVPLAPRRDASHTPRRVVPKKTLVIHEAPPPLPMPKSHVQPVKDHNASSRPASRTAGVFSSTSGKLKVFVDPPQNGEPAPQLVQKKKSRAALDSIKWALGDRTNVPKDAPAKRDKARSKEARLSVESDREKSDKEKWKWTLGRGKKDPKDKLGRDSPSPGSQPSSIRLQGPPASISSASTLNRATSPVPPPKSRSTTPAPEGDDSSQPKSGSIAVRAMRSVRSMARIGGWNRSESPTASMGNRLGKSSARSKDTGGFAGSGESWLVGSLAYPGSPTQNMTAPSQTVRAPRSSTSSSATSNSDRALPPMRFSSNAPTRASRLSTSTVSSGESVLPRESTSTHAPSIRSKRTSASSRRSSGGITSSSFWMPSSPIAETEAADSSMETTRRDSKSTDSGLRRSALTNVFDISTSSASSTPTSRRTQHSETPSSELASPVSRSAKSEVVDPFAAGGTDSYLPATIRGASSPPEISAPSPEKLIPGFIRPRPLSEQGVLNPASSRGTDDNTGGLTMVNAATDELSNLINRLDLTATPQASPSRHWLTTPRRSPDAMPEFAIATVERAIRHRYPDVPDSVHSKGNTTFNADSSFSSEATPQNVTRRILGNGPFSGSVSDLRRGAPGAGPFLMSSPRLESSISSLRPYAQINRSRNAVNQLPAIHLSPSSDVEPRGTLPSPPSPETSPRPRNTRRMRRSYQLREQSSGESLHAQLMPFSPEDRRSLGMSDTLGDQDTDMDSLSSGRDDPTSESADDEDSDIPDELRRIIAHRADDTTSSFQSQSLGYSLSSRPLSDSFDLTQSSQSQEPTQGSFVQPFSLTVTAPSISSHGSEEESPIDEEGQEDDTGKKSFDFTGEINRLNEAGARTSFVEQLEAAFKVPDDLQSPTVRDFESELGSPTALQWDLVNSGSNSTLRRPSPGHLDPAFKFGTPSPRKEDSGKAKSTISHHSRTDTQSSNLSEHEISLLQDLDASMYALATLNLSLVHPSSQSTLTGRPSMAAVTEQDEVMPVGDISLAQDIDSSAYKIATIDLSLIHPSGIRTAASSSPNDSTIEEESAIDSAVDLSPRQDTSSVPNCELDVSAGSLQSSLRIGHSRQESEMSVSSFGSVLYAGVTDPFGYKYGDVSEHPSTYAPSEGISISHKQNDSIASIPSISSYGQIIKGGQRNPFGYAASSKTSHTRDMSADLDNGVTQDDSMDPNIKGSRRQRRSRKSTDSDRSSFYFRSQEPPPPLPLPPLPEAFRAHKRDESFASIAPPVSLHNQSFRRHQRNKPSNDSGSSVALAYSAFGASGGRALWAKHQSDASVDSCGSDFSAAAVARPGLGDKMFSSAADYRGAPLTSITASPSASEAESSAGVSRLSGYSMVTDERRSSGDSDSFLKPNQTSDVSVFGAEESRSASSRGLLFGEGVGNQRRPLSVFSSASMSSSVNEREDDTMISMLGGGHISRKAIGDNLSASPCFKSRPRKKRTTFQSSTVRGPSNLTTSFEETSSADEHSPLSMQPSTTFGRKRMALAAQGLLERQSLEDSVLAAEGSDSSAFDRPAQRPLAPAVQRNIFAESLSAPPSRPTTIILTAAPDTPPASDCDSLNSQSHIDVTRLSVSEFTGTLSARSTRIRARGHGHRRRSPSRCSDAVFEGLPGLVSSRMSSGSSVSSMASTIPSARFDLINGDESHVDIVDVDYDTQGEIMQRYLTLRKQAFELVQQSKTEFADTDFSRFAVASFVPPKDPKAIQAFYDHSVKTYTHLPSDLCIRRPRTNSRPTPYSGRVARKTPGRRTSRPHSRTESMEQALSCISPPALAALPPNSPFAIDRSFSTFGVALDAPMTSTQEAFKPAVRPRVTSKVRRNALGWSKQRVIPEEKSEVAPTFVSATARGKENAEGVGMLKSANDSLRISRPRPKSRPQSTLGTVRAR